MIRVYKYRAYPNKKQEVMLAKHFGCCRWVWNWALAKKIEHYQITGKSLTWYSLSAILPILKIKEETEWLADVNAQSLQSVLANLDQAYIRFFKKTASFPKFKSKDSNQSCRFPQAVRIKGNFILLRKVGTVRIAVDREIKGKIKQAYAFREKSGKYYVSVFVETGKDLPASEPYSEKTMLGLDLGLSHFATMSDGTKVDNPRFLKGELTKIKKQQRHLNRKKKGSKNREKQRIRVALAHEKIRNQRKDFLHQLSSKLIRENQAIALEDLSVAGMIRNKSLALSISDVGWGTFVRQLEYKASWYGKTVIKIGRFDPSSRLCTCGIINRNLKISDRMWTCSSCGSTHDRDVLAANNIKHFALGRVTSEFTPVETMRIKGGRRSRKTVV